MSILHSKHWIARLVIAVVGLVTAEGFLNLILSGTIARSLWYTRGIHVPDEKYTFRFAPNYDGWQRHEDALFLERLTLDEHGHRNPAIGAAGSGEVVLIGGYSMTFSYGVPDSMSIHHVIARNLRTERTVRNTAWPGFDVYRNFHLYKDAQGSFGSPDLAVILFCEDSLPLFAELPVEQGEFVETTPRRDLFTFYPDYALLPPDGIARPLLARMYTKSLVLDRAASGFDRWARRRAVLRPLWKMHAQGTPERSSQEMNTQGAHRLGRFARYAIDHFGGLDHVLFVVLPKHQAQQQVDALVSALPPGAHVLDLNRTYNAAVDSLGTLGWGHYGPRSCALLGKVIAEEADRLLTE